MINFNKDKIINFIAFVKIKARKIRFYKSKEFKIFLLVIIILIGLAIIMPFFFDNSKLRNNISDRLSILTNSNIDIKGDVKVTLFPSPKIIIDNVFIENLNPSKNPDDNDKNYNIYAKNIEIIFPIFDWFESKIIKKIILNDVNVDIFKTNSKGKLQKSNFYTKLDFFNKINSRPPPSKNGISSTIFAIQDIESIVRFEGVLPDLQINNGKIIDYENGNINNEFINIDALIYYHKNKISGFGNFVSEKIDNSFEMELNFDNPKKNKTSFLTVKSAVLDFKLSGIFFDKNINGVFKTQFRGNFNGYVMELKNFYKSLISSRDSVSRKLKSNGSPINFIGEINSDGNEIDITNIFIESNLLKGVGSIKIDKSSKILSSDIKFDFEKLDIDGIWNTESPTKRIAEIAKGVGVDKNLKDDDINEKNSQPETEEEKNQNDDLKKAEKTENNPNIFLNIREYDIDLDITAQKANIFESKMEDLKLNANISNDDKMSIFPLSFKFPSGSEVRIVGNFDQEVRKNRFFGHIDSHGESMYEILEWLDIKPKNIKIKNLQKFNLYSDLEIGDNDYIFKNFYLNLNDKKTEIYGNVEIKDIKEKRIVTTDLKFSEFDYNKYISIPLKNTYFNEGVLIDKILWLNQIFYIYDLKFNFDKLIYGDEIFENQEFKINLGPGYLKIPNNKFKSQNNDFEINFNIDVSDKKQQLNLLIKANKLKIDFQKEYYDEEIPITKTIFDRFFQMPSLQGFEGKIDIFAKNFIVGDVEVNNFNYLIPITNSMNQSKLEMDIFDGKFEFSGINDIKYNKIINGNFNCKSCNLNKIFKSFYNVDNLDGVTNISGNIVGSGKSAYEFKKKLISEISFAISGPSARGYGLNDFIKKIYNGKSSDDEPKNPEDILHKKDSFTQFLQGKGFINLRGEKNSNFSISLKSTGVNSVFSGIIFVEEESINGTINTIFLAPNNQKQIPINIATNVTGYIDDVALVSNINQARQYLGLEKIEKTELDNILLAKTAEKKQAKKERIINNAKKLEKKVNEIDSKASENLKENSKILDSENIEIKKSQEIDEFDKINKESDFVIIEKSSDNENKESITNQDFTINNSIPSPINNNQDPISAPNPPVNVNETENINIVEPSI